ncbi:MAG TPA: AAA-like domain-containing protein [Candidatus Kapabacteria bacterium]|nr:AAA-like domain-containing protein [Candidatus Kapabacteria bacterium]
MSEQSKGLKIFIAYSHKDEKLKERLEVHLTILKRQGYIDIWHDGKIIPAENWDNCIKKEMETSNIILLLVSPDFLASKYIMEVELKRALELHRRGKIEVIPVILKDCDWKVEGSLSELEVLPDKGKPVANTKYWNSEDEAFTDIVKGIKKTLDIVRHKIATRIHPPGDPLNVEAPNYIERPADSQLDLLLEPMNPSTMYLISGGILCGKTSLLRRFKTNAQKKNFPTIHVDFQRLSYAENLNAGKVFEYIYQTIGEAKISRKIEKTPENKDEKGNIHWSKEKLFEYLKKHLETGEKTFLIIDSMDVLLSHSNDREPLNELISWLIMLRTYQGEAPFDELTIIAAMTILSYSPVYSSPLLTKAASIPLWYFGRTEIESLLKIYGIETDIEQISTQIFELFGGQPYLSHLAVYDLYQGSNLSDIKERAFEPINGYKDYWLNIKRVFERVLKIKNYDKNMVSVFKTLSSENKTPPDYKVFHDLFEELYRLGIIGMNHELSSDFIKKLVRKEIEIK